MFLTLLKAKIHRARVTQTELHYEGSITLPPAAMAAAGLLEHELVHVVNVDNGERFQTYAIAGTDDRTYCLNGAAARLAVPGDTIIVMAYAMLDERQAREHRPTVVRVDGDNAIVEVRR